MKFQTLLILLILSSCTDSPKESTREIFDGPHTFLKEELRGLQERKPSLHKSIVVNGKAQDKLFDEPDWQSEFSLLSNLDDTLLSDYAVTKKQLVSGLVETRYADIDPKSGTPLVYTYSKGDSILGIYMYNEARTPVYQSARHSFYSRGKWIAVDGYLSVEGMKPSTYQIRSEILE